MKISINIFADFVKQIKLLVSDLKRLLCPRFLLLLLGVNHVKNVVTRVHLFIRDIKVLSALIH